MVNQNALTIEDELPPLPAPLPEGARKVCECGGGNWIKLSPNESFQIPHVMSHPVHKDR